jgi:hypothetical protein
MEFKLDSLVLSCFILIVLVTAVVAETIGLVNSSDSIDDIRSVEKLGVVVGIDVSKDTASLLTLLTNGVDISFVC